LIHCKISIQISSEGNLALNFIVVVNEISVERIKSRIIKHARYIILYSTEASALFSYFPGISVT
jgi:hypothetical protein